MKTIQTLPAQRADESIGRALGLLLRKFRGPILEMSPEAVLIKAESAPARRHPAADEELVSYARQAFYQLKETDRPTF
jgi:hypothetical protein